MAVYEDNTYIPSSDEMYRLCHRAYEVARGGGRNMAPTPKQLHRLNIALLQSAKKQIQDPLTLARAERTIAHLQTRIAAINAELMAAINDGEGQQWT